MTYDAIERSEQSGRPVELFTWQRGAQIWRETSADRAVPVGADTFNTEVINRPNITQGSELNRSAMNLQVRRDHPIAVLFRAGIPVDGITLRIQQYHEGDGELIGVWGGRVINVSFEPGGATLVCEPVFTSVRQMGLRRRYQRQCPFVLYGQGCNVVAADFKLTTEVVTVDGLEVTAAGIDSEADGWWEGGFMQWQPSAGVYERRFIKGHTGTAITLTTQPLGLTAGFEIDVFPGCDHTLATCAAKFGNSDNHGGCPDIPRKNPFGNDPIY